VQLRDGTCDPLAEREAKDPILQWGVAWQATSHRFAERESRRRIAIAFGTLGLGSARPPDGAPALEPTTTMPGDRQATARCLPLPTEPAFLRLIGRWPNRHAGKA
jgi:hypothetical protein